MARRERSEIVVEQVAGTTRVRPVDDSDDPVWIIPNSRDAGYWAVFRGPAVDAATDMLSGGYATHAEALSAARTLAAYGIRRLPRAEAKGVHLDPDSPWYVYGWDDYWPLGPGMFAAITRDDPHEQGMVLVSPKELPKIQRAWERGETPHVSFPPRRFIPHAEAVEIRMRIYAARMGAPGG